MTSETIQPKKPELSMGEMNQQNHESYSYLKSLVSDDETPINIDEETVLRFQQGGKHLRGRLDKVEVTFHNKGSQIEAERYVVCDGGLLEFGVNSEPFVLSSGLQVEMSEYREHDNGHGLLREEDRGSRTAAKVIADTIRAKIAARNAD